MLMRNEWTFLLTGILSVLLVITGCGESQQQNTETTDNAAAGISRGAAATQQVGQARYNTELASSLEEMVQNYDTIIIGRVQGIAVPYDPRPGFLGQPTPEPAPSGHPKAGTFDEEALSRPLGRTFTTYSVA